jgi:membrane fusion protein, multidrug efflux system
MRVSAVVASFVLGAISLTVLSCAAGDASSTSPPTASGAARSAAILVAVATAQRKAMPVEIRALGSVEPYSTVGVHAQLTGQLTTVDFTEGDDVREGQALFTLDRRPLEATLRQAQANLDRDLAQAANAAAQAGRYKDLAARGIVATEQVESSAAAATALRATVDADRAAVDSAKVQLQYATIAAPLSGRTGALMAHEGSLVRANDTVPLVVINQTSPVYVSFGIPEARLAELKRHLAHGAIAVRASPPAEAGEAAPGRITFVDNTIDPATGTIKLKGTFANVDGRLWPGQFVNVVATLTTDPNALVVPMTAIQAGQQGSFVFRIKPDQTVELRPVDVAWTQGADAVIARGLEAGDAVVTEGHLRLTPGSRIVAKADEGQGVVP